MPGCNLDVEPVPECTHLEWMRIIRLKLNPARTETLWVSGFQVQELGSLPVPERVVLPLKEQVISLGLLLKPSLPIETQVASVLKSTYHLLQLMCQLHPFQDRDNLATVTHTFATSCLEYCNAL